MSGDVVAARGRLPVTLRDWVVDGDGHWVWGGATNKWGYAFNGRNVARDVFTVLVLGGGPFHQSKVLQRRCDVKACVNPAHMVYQNRAALQRKQTGAVLPEWSGRGCDHEVKCTRCGCGVCGS